MLSNKLYKVRFIFIINKKAIIHIREKGEIREKVEARECVFEIEREEKMKETSHEINNNSSAGKRRKPRENFI